MSFAKECKDFRAALRAECAGLPWRTVTRAASVLIDAAASHYAASLASCNGPEDRERRAPGFTWDAWEENRKAREDAAESLATGAAGLLGLKVTFSGDPRGWTVHVHLPKTGRFNTWGGLESGYTVPVRGE